MSIDTTVDNIIFSPALPEGSRPKIAGSNNLQVVSPLTRFTGALTIDSNVGIGTASAGEKLEVAGNIKIIGDSIINGQALKIMQINRPDWLCINPDEGYPGTALYKPVAINNGGLAVGELSQLAPGQLKVVSSAYLATNSGSVGIGTDAPAEKLEVAGNVKISGDSIKNFQGYRIIETNKSDWLRINPDGSYPGIALYKPVAISTGGLAVGELSQLAQGQLKVTSSAFLATNGGNVGIGTAAPAEKLEVAGNVKISGDSIKNFQGYRIIETNKSDWLRINPDGSYPGIALYKPVAIGNAGLAVGEWSQLAEGQLKVTSSAYLATNGGNVGIGTATPNASVKLDVEGGAYLGYANSITNFNGILKSGFYQGVDPITGDVPDTSHGWSHLFVLRHSNTQNNHQLQIAGTYAMNDRLFFRKIAGGLEAVNSSWNEFATRGSNKFTGNQEVMGNINTTGEIRAGNSDIYFTKTDHNHTGIGNQAGYAAIENATNYGALMILGRAGTAQGRCVKLWDYLQVNGNLEVNNTISAPGRMHIDGGELLYLLNKSGVIIGKEWGGNGNLNVQGDISLNGLIGTNGFSPAPITPGWGGGIHTWDVEAEGTIWSRHGYQNGGRDYAEYFEALDGQEILPGTSVILVGNKVRPAKKGEIPFGVISAVPGVVGNVYKDWPDKYLKDVFGNSILEEYQEEVLVPKKEKVTKERPKTEKRTVTEEVGRIEIVLEKGKYCQKQITEKVTREIAQPLFKEVDLYDGAGKKIIGKHQAPVMETWEEEINVFGDDGKPVMVGTGKYVTKKRPKLNPKYDDSKEYTIRELRLEWNCVGLLGQLPVCKGQPVAPNWIKLEELSDEVELWLVK